MGKYILKRILFFIPTLIIISLLAFVISINAPGDPLDRMVSARESGGEMGVQQNNTQKEEDRWRKKLGLDLPVFYFSITTLATPDTLYKIYDENERDALKRLLNTYGNWPQIAAWYRSVKDLELAISKISPDSVDINKFGKNAIQDSITNFKIEVSNLKVSYNDKLIQLKLNYLKQNAEQLSYLHTIQNEIKSANDNYLAMESHSTKYKNYIPSINFYKSNQYHRWIFGDGNWLTGKGNVNCAGLIRGDFGYSYETKLKVSDIISERMKWSLFFTMISILLAYLISLPIGLKAAANKNSLFDRTSSVILFVLYSMPTFWVATLLLMGFANTEALSVFPASGIQPVTGIPEGSNFLEVIRLRLPYLILPTIAYTYSQLAFLSRITRVSALEVISQDYIRTARAKGLSDGKVLYKHVFRNTLLPIITVFSNVFPLAISGSVILETIFTIPGMGQQIFHAIQTNDYPVIIDVFTLTGVLTLVGYLIADILYAIADPRISYSNNQ